ncbi:acyl-CoA thioesterase [Actinoalloteichus hymeniacidonis]|uniref:Thioesterase n=1 Tax=Actinoalloteichus hymeniacidonis TaxID=340345 RepID=A0AAC9HQN2_9PSEU|nr:acyl-CoA thioesterase [Actinoalloteichus hymeniacidonis]AOS63640.1 putative thioesterase [Actinoalloteichus hymeniacidonis]MBB5908312.1 YbgC/YbaW family acyl-CoA thioester hydrolase [Actinoalloteichus hymeniacidonis]
MNLLFRLLWLRIRSRRWPRTDIWAGTRTPFRVTLTDLDLQMHMNNGKYLSLLDLGRIDMMNRSGLWSKVLAKGWYPVVAGQTITYRKSLKLGERFAIHSRIAGFDERAVYIEQSFYCGTDLYARATVKARFLKRAGGSVSQQELADLVGGFPEDLQLPDWITDWSDATRLKSARSAG